MSTRRILILCVVAALLLVLGGVALWRTAKREAVAALTKPRETTIDLTTLVTRTRELSRLETASMRIVHVSTITQSYGVVPQAIGGDELTLMAAGDVIAGVDLSILKPGDVWREADGTIVMRLPPAQILVSRIDNRETRVLSRKTGVLRRSDKHLESRARQHAEQAVRNEAMKKGIIPMATRNAQGKLAEFLRTLGAEKVRFVDWSMAGPQPQL